MTSQDTGKLYRALTRLGVYPQHIKPRGKEVTIKADVTHTLRPWFTINGMRIKEINSDSLVLVQ